MELRFPLRRVAWVALIVSLAGADLPAANRFVIDDAEFPVNSTGNRVTLRMESDQTILGFSINLRYDAADIQITSVDLGGAVVPLDPEWNDGTIDNTNGRLSWAVVFDFSGPTLTKQLAAGGDHEILELTFDVVRQSASTETLDLRDDATTEPRRLNVMTDENGDSVSPTLVDGAITVVDLRPVIQSFVGNSGDIGTQFFIEGLQFDQPGLEVRVCDTVVAHTLIAPTTIQVSSPECGPGPAEVEVCTDFGCDSDPSGFTYPELPDAPVIESFLGNSGLAGEDFFVVGQNFDQAGLTIRVCGVEAEFTLLGDNQTAEVIAPECGQEGWSQVRVSTEFGFDLENEGFFYEGSGGDPIFLRGDTNGDSGFDLSDGVTTLGWLFLGRNEPGCQDAADANDDGNVDLGDAIYTFNFLFLGGDLIPPPFDGCGVDPTSDDVDCLEVPDGCL